jgi:S1-C subfamily serine protease
MPRAVLVVFLAVSAFAGGLTAQLMLPRLESVARGQVAPPTIPAPSVGQEVRADLAALGDRFEQVARKVSPAVVYVEAAKPPVTSSNTSSGNGKNKPVEESGSGVLVRFDGHRGTYVLTNNHVVAQAANDRITIHLADGRLFHPNRVWTDPESDVAVLRIDADNLPTAPMGDSDRMRVGQWVLAIGSPFGLNQTVTHGIISARERGQISLGNTIRIKDFLQTDAAINPGSSGGPLVNLDGQVIGINTAIASHNGNNSGVAFSIPINLARRVSLQLLEKGTVARGYLGVQLAASFEPADAFRLGLDRVQGALVETVYPDTPAAQAGLKADDVVLQIDGTIVRGENHLINHVSALPAGQRIRLIVWRDRKQIALDAVVGDWSRGQSKFRANNP